MKALTRITFWDEEGTKFFGEGPCRLLHAVEETGSLRAAAFSMGMAYTKALKLINTAENALGYSLTTRSTGGRSGGGTSLTPKGKAWLAQYEAYRNACIQVNQRLYEKFFPESHYDRIGCVIMASGLGNRFGGNKLMVDFRGQPLMQSILDATSGLFSHRVVVTRHKEVEALCREQGISCVFHALPYRSDTIRLGLEFLGADLEGYLFCPADQPLLRRETLTQLVEAFSHEPNHIWRPSYNDTPCSPVLFPRWAFEALSTLPDGKGGGAVVKMHAEAVRTIPIQDPREMRDIDTREDWKALIEGLHT